MTLKQGFGRLIRTQKDAGIVGILDRRIVRKGYGRALLGEPAAGAAGAHARGAAAVLGGDCAARRRGPLQCGSDGNCSGGRTGTMTVAAPVQLPLGTMSQRALFGT